MAIDVARGSDNNLMMFKWDLFAFIILAIIDELILARFN